MHKTYFDCMNEISKEELYDRLIEYGLFSNKLPPLFTGKDFLSFCKNADRQNFERKWYNYANYSSTRNINIPRSIGIPAPMGYEILCKSLSDNWDKIVEHFRVVTQGQKRKVSRIHIRKMINNPGLFDMNYSGWKTDGTLIPDIMIGKKFLIHADISQCYPSIYTHAIPWALVGKNQAKKTVNDDIWYNQLDTAVQYTKNGETHGLLIGPHASNILSEIILCSIDNDLNDWDYYRTIDDYYCFVEKRDQADDFLLVLNEKLKQFGLSLNYKKMEVEELPYAITNQWSIQIKDKIALFKLKKDNINYNEMRAFLDFCVVLMSQNKDNASILFYGLKLISGFPLTKNAKNYLIKYVISLALLFPYIIPILDKQIFEAYDVDRADILYYSKRIFKFGIEKKNYEASSYALFWAIKYDLDLGKENFNIQDIIKCNDCVILTSAYIYCKKRRFRGGTNSLKDYAKDIIDRGEMELFWLFVYEILGKTKFENDWAAMKAAKVSFIKPEYR